MRSHESAVIVFREVAQGGTPQLVFVNISKWVPHPFPSFGKGWDRSPPCHFIASEIVSIARMPLTIETVSDTYILGIESSCDETSAAVVRSGEELISNVVYSQIATHQPYGGVVPELASREHLRAIVPVIRQALDDAGKSYETIDAIAVTKGPGLAGSLLVGLSYAKAR